MSSSEFNKKLAFLENVRSSSRDGFPRTRKSVWEPLASTPSDVFDNLIGRGSMTESLKNMYSQQLIKVAVFVCTELVITVAIRSLLLRFNTRFDGRVLKQYDPLRFLSLKNCLLVLSAGIILLFVLAAL